MMLGSDKKAPSGAERGGKSCAKKRYSASRQTKPIITIHFPPPGLPPELTTLLPAPSKACILSDLLALKARVRAGR